MKMKRYQFLADRVNAYKQCKAQWSRIALEQIEKEMKKAPSGSGIDCGTKIDLELSGGEKLIFTFDYHCMDDNGCYDGWINGITLHVTPSLKYGYKIKFGSYSHDRYCYRKYWGLLEEYLYDVYDYWISEEIDI